MLKRNLVTSLLLYESIRTTRNRAKAIQPLVDRLLRAARKQTPHAAIRTINRVVTDKNACRKIMEVLKARYADRESGLTRMTPVGSRLGDGAPLVDLTLVDAVMGAAPARRKDAEETDDSKASVSSKSSASSVSHASKKEGKKLPSKKT